MARPRSTQQSIRRIEGFETNTSPQDTRKIFIKVQFFIEIVFFKLDKEVLFGLDTENNWYSFGINEAHALIGIDNPRFLYTCQKSIGIID